MPTIKSNQAVLLSFNVCSYEPSYFNMVEYGRGDNYDNVVIKKFDKTLPSDLIPKPVIMVDLSKPGVYHYRVTSCNLAGHCATSENHKISITKK